MSSASNVIDLNIVNEIMVFEDIPGPAPAFLFATSSDIPTSVSTSATQRIGLVVVRSAVTGAAHDDLEVDGGKRVGAVTLFGDNQDISEIDKFRQGRNIKHFKQFSKGLLPAVTINTEGFTHKDGTLRHDFSLNNFGQGSLFKTYDDRTRKFIPFEDFPGKLDPVAFV